MQVLDDVEDTKPNLHLLQQQLSPGVSAATVDNSTPNKSMVAQEMLKEMANLAKLNQIQQKSGKTPTAADMVELGEKVG